jgi:hypothetical protein
MKRRSLLQGAAAAALGVPALSGLAQQSVTLKFHTFMAPQSNVWLSMHKPWMEKVEKESGGRIKFEGYPAMQLGGTPVQLYDQARDGVVDVVWTLPATPPAASRGRGVRAAVHHDQRRGGLEGVLGVHPDPGARRVQGDPGARAARARPGHVPFGDQAGEGARPTSRA